MDSMNYRPRAEYRISSLRISRLYSAAKMSSCFGIPVAWRQQENYCYRHRCSRAWNADTLRDYHVVGGKSIYENPNRIFDRPQVCLESEPFYAYRPVMEFGRLLEILLPPVRTGPRVVVSI